MRETWAALVSRSSYGNCKQTHGVWLGRGRGGGGSRPGKVLGVLNTAVGAGQVLGTAELRLGRKGHGS